MKPIEESEAIRRWCPHALIAFEVKAGIFVAVNRRENNANPQWARCQAKECIYWEREQPTREERAAWKAAGARDHRGRCTYGEGVKG